jgi:hypothetical protein
LRWTISNSPCTASTDDVVITYTAPPTTATVGGTQNICGVLVSGALGGNTPGAGTGAWSKSSGPGTVNFSAWTSGSSTATVDAYGTYVFTWTISNGTCTPSTADVTVNFYETPSAPTAGSDSPICAGSTLHLTATEVTGATYAWTGPDNFTSSDRNPTITSATTAATGTYSVTATISGCPSAAGTTTATVNPAAATSAISGSGTVAINQLGQTYSVALTSGSSYAWTVPSGASITAGAGTAAITVNFGSTGGNVTVTETTAASCVGAPVSLVVSVSANHAPVAPANKTLSTPKNTAAAYALPKLLAGATDADNDTLTVTAASTPTPHGGTVLLEASDVKYTPATDYTGSDSYTYTISDGNGGTAMGTVDVTVTSNGGESPNIVVAPTYTNGTFRVTFAGIPNYEYTVQYSESPTGPWSYLKQAMAGTNGLFEVTDDPLPETPARYYRTVYP